MMREVVLLLLLLQWIQSVDPLPLSHLIRPQCSRGGLCIGRPCRSALRLNHQKGSANACEAHCAAIETHLSTQLNHLCGDSANILVCVSGGSDSMALLHLLQRVRERRSGLALRVVNFNHKARVESDEEVGYSPLRYNAIYLQYAYSE
jgi:asparagine synthetase B (glutamine-hydrolysing)